jgi:LDH2 family malate/lactate/ureidoglycolate dehydrogenase
MSSAITIAPDASHCSSLQLLHAFRCRTGRGRHHVSDWSGPASGEWPMVDVDIVRTRRALELALAAAGADQREAMVIADSLVEGELCGVPTHGLMKLSRYADGLASGKFKPATGLRVEQRSVASAAVDGAGALGFLPTVLAIEAAVPMARAVGVGVVGVRHIADFGRAAYFTELAVAEGLVCLVCQNTLPLLSSPGSTSRTHGNNPLAYVAPTDDGPLFDAAFTPRSMGELARRRMLGLPLPADWGYLDEAGAPTTDATAAIGSVMPPVGGAKGFGLALMVDLLAGALTGAASGPEVQGDGAEVGAFVLALSPDIFGFGAGLGHKLSIGAEAVRTTGGRWPGDRARASRAHALARGRLGLPEPIFEHLVGTLERYCRPTDVDISVRPVD